MSELPTLSALSALRNYGKKPRVNTVNLIAMAQGKSTSETW